MAYHGTIKIAATIAEWDYPGLGQPQDGDCVRCGCCGTEQLYEDLGDGLYYCNGRCDRNAVHPPEEPSSEDDERELRELERRMAEIKARLGR